MLDSLLCERVGLSENGLLLCCGPVTLVAEAPNRDSERLVDAKCPVEVTLQLEITDEALVLIAFASPARRKLYRALRGVSGIGRRSALNVLDCGETIDTLRAVSGNDPSYFHEVPGLGKARISAIIKELGKHYSDVLPKPLPLPVHSWVEARDALLHQGQNPQEAEASLRAVLEKAKNMPQSAEELLRKIAKDSA